MMPAPRPPNRVRRLALVLVLGALCGGLVGCDHATKRLAAARLEGRAAVEVVAGVVSLRYVENRDSAFGLLRRLAPTARRPLLVGASLVITGLCLTLWWQRRRAAWPLHLAFALVVAGGLGNLIDRAFRGYVVDFIHVRYWPVFNVADAYLVMGIALLVLLGRRAGGAPTTS